MENMENKPKWYILQTLSGYEKVAQNNLLTMTENNNLQDYIFDVVVPEEEEIVTDKKGKTKVVMRRKFPSYVFIKMIYTKHVWYLITQTRGVTSFCGPGGRPLAISDEEVKRNQLEKITADEFDIQIGDTVEVLSGALLGRQGEVKDIDFDSQKVKVSVNLFGKETPTELGFIDVRKVNA